MFNPGALSANMSGEALGGVLSHSELSKDCNACHSAPWSNEVMSNLCLDCHVNIPVDFKNSSSLHGILTSSQENIDCLDCHVDHRGKKANISFFIAEGEITHENSGFSLIGHTKISSGGDVNCIECHAGTFRSFNQAVCQDCHQNLKLDEMSKHTGIFGIDCLACHDGIDTYGEFFDHNEFSFMLIGIHKMEPCEACHENSRSLIDLQETNTGCVDCHLEEDIHSGELSLDCGECHNPHGWEDVVYDHNETGFALVDKHDGLDCDECHEEGETYQGLDTACESCHLEDDAHNNIYGLDCALCHIEAGWDQIVFDHETANADDCESCHSTETPLLHYPGQCSLCHSTSAWDPANFDHQGSRANDCFACHASITPIPHYSGLCNACHSTSAWLPASFNHQVALATDCNVCHINDKPSNHYDGQCSLCHKTTAWTPASFDHTFPINHEGANSDCQLCHIGPTYSTYTCYGCHEHSQNNVAEEHDDISNFSNCIECHADGKEHDDD